MKHALTFCLLVLVTAVVCEESRPELKPRPVGVIYLIQVLNRPSEIQNDYSEISNAIPNENPFERKEPSKLLLALAPSYVPEENGREKRSATYKKKGGYGGGGCNVCGGGYPSYGGGGYPSHGGYGGGGGGGGAFAQASSYSSASSGGYGGGYGK